MSRSISRRVVLTGAGGALALGVGASVLSWRTSADAYRRAVEDQRAALSGPADARALVRYATLAASGHNTQPWHFRIGPDEIAISPDTARRTPVVDPDDHHLYVSLGCALENLVLAAGATGQAADVVMVEDGMSGASVRLSGNSSPGADDAAMFQAIPGRQSCRALYDGTAVATSDLAHLETASQVPGVDLILLTDRPQLDAVRDLVIDGNAVQMADPAFLRELKDWLRFSPDSARESGDGLYAAASGNPALPEWLGRPAFDLVFKAPAENEKYARQMDSSAGVAVFCAASEGPAGWMAVGRACQRFCLMATALGLRTAFVNQPVEVAALRPQLATIAGLGARRPDLVLRFGRTSQVLPFSARRPVEAVLLA
ncbi:MAG: Tat pathway signal protein [Pseudorhizobium pelagicum]|uniref:Acg family FMN-binding oxidoreductase n=1 Tax=Pseudorhizobium pelagicum TaxID=1509405 RepID=UPI00345FCF5C